MPTKAVVLVVGDSEVKSPTGSRIRDTGLRQKHNIYNRRGFSDVERDD